MPTGSAEDLVHVKFYVVLFVLSTFF